MRRLYPLIGRYFAHATPEITMVLDAKELKAHLDSPFELDAYAPDLQARPFIAVHP
jgi:hypothetical protein